MHFDSVASWGGTRPSDRDIDRLVARMIDSESPMSAEKFRTELISWQRSILEAAGRGSSGEARRLAREATAVLATALGPLPPVDRDERPLRDIINEVPR